MTHITKTNGGRWNFHCGSCGTRTTVDIRAEASVLARWHKRSC